MTLEARRIAVIDDVLDSAETTAGVAEEAGFRPSVISEPDGVFSRSQELFDLVWSMQCSAVICDHRLSQTPFATFSGAELLSLLYRARIPSLLVSTFSAIDSDSSIRLYRAFIPSLIPREHLDPEHLQIGLKTCSDELDGRFIPARRARRTLVRVVEVRHQGDVPVVDAIIHTWNPARAIRFPLALVENRRVREALMESDGGQTRLFASVNIGCRRENELYLREFEFAPDPDVTSLAK